MKQKPSLQDYRLYLVTDSHFTRGYSVLEQVDLALRGGIKMIQIREKELCSDDCVNLVSEALRLTRPRGAFLIVNDRADVAATAGADGLHIGQGDIPLREARALVGDDVIIGVSVKTVEETIRAQNGGADYVAVNGVFPTATKEDLGNCPGLEGVAKIRQSTTLPVVAIGGITLQNCHSVIDAGAHGIAVVTAITMSRDIPLTCSTFFNLIGGEAAPG